MKKIKHIKCFFYCSIVFLFIIGCTNSKQHSIQIYKSLGGIQCQKTFVSIEKLHQELLKANIHLIGNGSKGDDGIMRITVCGAPTGEIGIFTISQYDFTKAAEIGFLEYKRTQ